MYLYLSEDGGEGEIPRIQEREEKRREEKRREEKRREEKRREEKRREEKREERGERREERGERREEKREERGENSGRENSRRENSSKKREFKKKKIQEEREVTEQIRQWVPSNKTEKVLWPLLSQATEYQDNRRWKGSSPSPNINRDSQ